MKENLLSLSIDIVAAKRYEHVKLYNFSPGEGSKPLPISETIEFVSDDIVEDIGVDDVFAIFYTDGGDIMKAVSLNSNVFNQRNVKEFLSRISGGVHLDIIEHGEEFLRSFRYETGKAGMHFSVYSATDCVEIAAVEEDAFKRFCFSNRDFTNLVRLLRAFGIKI